MERTECPRHGDVEAVANARGTLHCAQCVREHLQRQPIVQPILIDEPEARPRRR